MPAGYDKRTRYSDRVSGQRWTPDGLLYRSVHGQLKKAEVTSYRSNTQGTPLNPKAVDLYSGFLNRNSGLAAYLNPGPRLLAELEASGLAEDSDRQNELGFTDNGHPFTLERREWKCSTFNAPFRYSSTSPVARAQGFAPTLLVIEPGAINKNLGWTNYFTSGPSSGTRRWALSTEIPSPTTDRLKSDGTSMLAQVAPGRPPVDLVATVGELFAGLPVLPGHALLRGGLLPSVGSEYLNLVFGLIPTHGDAVDVAKAMKTVSTRLLQLRKDAGKPVRRKMALPIEQKSEILSGPDLRLGSTNISAYALTDLNFGYNPVVDYAAGGGGTAGSVYTQNVVPSLFLRETRKVWFSGSFTYFVPTIPGLSGKLERYLSEYDRLLGLSLNSSNAWQLSPWSWLIDWFLDIRQNLDAISVAHDDNLVVNYGYAMEQNERSVIAKLQFLEGSGMFGNPYLYSGKTLTSKRRIRANPYGFVNEQDSSQWSAYRLAVLGALGLTKV